MLDRDLLRAVIARKGDDDENEGDEWLRMVDWDVAALSVDYLTDAIMELIGDEFGRSLGQEGSNSE